MNDNFRVEIGSLLRRMDRNTHRHVAESLRLQEISNTATFVVSLGGTAATVLSAALMLKNRPGEFVEVALIVVSVIITLVSLWLAIWKPSERSLKHRMWAAQFAELEDECRLFLAGADGADAERTLKRASLVSQSVDLIPTVYWKKELATDERRQRA